MSISCSKYLLYMLFLILYFFVVDFSKEFPGTTFKEAFLCWSKESPSQPDESASSEQNCLTLKIYYSEFNLENSDMLRKVGHKILFCIKYVAIIFGRRSFQKLKWQLCKEAVTLLLFSHLHSFGIF